MAIVINGSGTVTGLAVGGLPDGTVDSGTIATGTIVDADVANVAASKLTGALPAISGASLTNLPSKGKNLIINGAMRVAQRGTSSTSDGRQTVDRFHVSNGSNDELPTQAQHALTSSDTEVWAEGFRHSYHMTNGNQTSGAQGGSRVCFQYYMEAQDIATSGWDYTSSSSYITLSFWCKSSVAQNFYGRLRAHDGTGQGYAFETGSLSANAWTKITKTIPGNSNLTFDNDSGTGLEIEIVMFRGTTKTGTRPLNAWAAFDGDTRVPDMDSTWYTTNDATWEITGVQLELGSTATDFEHRSYGEELALCQRYYFRKGEVARTCYGIGAAHTNTGLYVCVLFPVTMRASPTMYQHSDSTKCYITGSGQNQTAQSNAFGVEGANPNGITVSITGSGLTGGNAYWFNTTNSTHWLAWDAEL